MGRRKIEIKRIENNEARHVTFCKRRNGLFKKLAELCIHCDSHAAALVYSPGRRVHVFSHPDAPSVINRFLGGPLEQAAAPPAATSLERETTLSALCREVEAILEAEKGRKQWWEGIDLEGMEADELRRLRRSVAELRQTVIEKMVQVGERGAEKDTSWMDGALMLPYILPDFSFLGATGFFQLMPRSVLCGGSTGVFILLYCFCYYHARSDMSGFMQTSFFFGYMACVSYGFFLMLGTVGFRASLLFVRHIHRRIK